MKKVVDNTQTEHQLLSDDGKKIVAGEIIIGTVVGLDKNSQALVEFYANNSDEPRAAVSTLPIYKQHVGRQAALLFANGDPAQPVIIGLIHNPLDEMLENYSPVPEEQANKIEQPEIDSEVDDIRVDGKRLVIEGKQEIVLKCGASSITLTKEGKILIRGKYLLNRSTGINRILGGSVQIN